MKEVLKALGKQLVDDMDGWTASVCTQLDQQQTFLSWTHNNGKKTITISEDICLTHSGSRKEKERKPVGCWKQKLFDYVPESACAERQGRPSSLKWVLKNKGEKVSARLVVREIKKAKSEDEKLEPSDVFSAMPPVESLKALVSHVMTERVDRRGRNLGACSLRRVKSTLLRCV